MLLAQTGPESVLALMLAGGIALAALFSLRRQLATFRKLRGGEAIASDDRRFFHNQALRRTVCGGLLLLLSAMIAGNYVLGIDDRREKIAEQRDARQQAGDPMTEKTEEEKQFIRTYVGLWIGVLLLVFLVTSVAIMDIWSTRRYAVQQMRRMRNEHLALLERDLAVHRMQKQNDRFRGFT